MSILSESFDENCRANWSFPYNLAIMNARAPYNCISLVLELRTCIRCIRKLLFLSKYI